MILKFYFILNKFQIEQGCELYGNSLDISLIAVEFPTKVEFILSLFGGIS